MSTRNKLHTTYLYLPSIILYVTYTSNTHKLYILDIHMYMHITLIFYTFNLIYTYYINIYWTYIIVRSKSYRTCPYSEQTNKQIVSSNNINKFVSDQYTYVDIQYMNVPIKVI